MEMGESDCANQSVSYLTPDSSADMGATSLRNQTPSDLARTVIGRILARAASTSTSFSPVCT